ncbi:MAG: HEAT repeat domain-containing protein [Fimbriimonadales bacterium]
MAVEIELQVPCSEGVHKVRVRLESWERWKVLTSDCMELMGRAFGLMAACYHNTMQRGREVQLQAVERLSQARAVPLLIQALQDGYRDVRAAAWEALGGIGDASAVPALTQALKD